MELDKVERSLVAQVQRMKPEYAELEPYQVAKMELRYRLFEEIGRLKTQDQTTHKTGLKCSWDDFEQPLNSFQFSEIIPEMQTSD